MSLEVHLLTVEDKYPCKIRSSINADLLGINTSRNFFEDNSPGAQAGEEKGSLPSMFDSTTSIR